MHDKHATLFYLIDRLIQISDTYTNIKANESERNTNTLLGRWAIKYNIIFFIFFAGATAFGIWSVFMFKASSVLFGVLLIIAALSCLITSIVFVILAFACEINQMKLNSKPIGLVSLLTTVVIILVAVVAIVITILIGG